MSGIQALSDAPKGGNKLDKLSTSEGRDVAEGSKNVAEVFAAMLSGFINQNVDPKGQNSSVAGQDLEENPTTDIPVQSTQPQNRSVSMLGYGNFGFKNLSQGLLQSDLPAGKEANSGESMSQGTVGSASAKGALPNVPIVTGNNLELGLLKLVSLASEVGTAQSGMTTPNPQGNNPEISELDKYRPIIAKLLIELSGEISNLSPKGNHLSLEGVGPMNFRQEMAKIIQGWTTVTEDVADDAQAATGQGQKRIQPLVDLLTAKMGSSDPELTAKVFTLLAALNPKSNQRNEGIEGAKPSQETNLTLQGKGDTLDPVAKVGLDPLLKQLKGTDLNSVATQVKDTPSISTNVQQKSEGMSTQKGDNVDSIELSRGKDVQYQKSSTVGVLTNIATAIVLDGKTVGTPVLEQITTVIREQVMDRRQALKELDIQLNPADLGKIRIGIRWENGQVHLIVHASEPATGQLLQNQLSDLRQNLTNQGVNCGMLQMGQGGERQQNSRGDESHRMFNQNSNSDEGEEQSTVFKPPSLEQDGINRINVTA